MTTQREARHCLEAICKRSSGLSDSELLFVQVLMLRADNCISNDEKEAIMELYDKVVM